MNLLMIDDDILDLEWISAMIAKMPFSFEKTFLASNVKHAKEIFGKYRIDIALVDIEMPGGESGLDLTKWIVGEKYETIVIFVTSHGRFDYATEALRLQARDYLLKPVSDDALYESLQRAVSFLQMNKPEIDFMDESSVVNKIKRYIKDHVQERISRENLADIVYLHPDYISRIFKEETGTTLGDYILQQKITLAKDMLMNTNKSITEIGIDVGFGNTSYFDRVFRRFAGITPKQFREER